MLDLLLMNPKTQCLQELMPVSIPQIYLLEELHICTMTMLKTMSMYFE